MEDEHEPTDLDEQVALLLNSDGGVLGHYIVIAEIVYPTHVQLQVTVSGGMSPWTARGMLDQALEEVVEASHHAMFHPFPEDIDGEENE